MLRRDFLKGAAAALAVPALNAAPSPERRLIYVAEPGIRNYVQYGGVGIVVFDRDNGHKFVKRIPTWGVLQGQEPENVKGVAARAKTGKIYVSTIKRMCCVDLLTGKKTWDQPYEGGCDRMAISPDGKILYTPSLEGPFWTVVNAATGAVITKVVTDSGSHNTIYSPAGKFVYLAGLKSNLLNVADPKTHTVVKKVGPFGNVIRPFTINGKETLVFVNVNDLLGFEIGDLQTGKMLHRVEVKGYEKGAVKRHGCPSHGIAMTVDETELWVSDGHNNMIHIFDATTMPPKQMTSLKVRDLPGWITPSIDGKLMYSSSGEVFDTASKKMVAALQDEEGREVGSEKLLELIFANGKPVKAGDQFGIGGKRS